MRTKYRNRDRDNHHKPTRPTDKPLNDIYFFTMKINGEIQEVALLEFIGFVGHNNWMHFVNTKTKENHLCHPEHFPSHKMKSYNTELEFIYTI